MPNHDLFNQEPPFPNGYDHTAANDDLSPEQRRLVELRTRLLDNGYEPIAVNGKRPFADGWQRDDITRERILQEAVDWLGSTNTGLRTDHLAVVDIDLKSDDHTIIITELVEQKIGETPMLRRGAKGFHLPYRLVGDPISKIVIKEYLGTETRERKHAITGATTTYEAKLYRNLVEILGSGNQMVAFGTHPDTGEPFRWFRSDPLTIPYADLPAITPDQLHDLADAIKDELAKLGYKVQEDAVSGGDVPADALPVGMIDDADDITDKFNAVMNFVPRRRIGPAGFRTCHCPGCNKPKGGFKITADGGWRYCCVYAGCPYLTGSATGWSPGRPLGERERDLYAAMGGDPDVDFPRPPEPDYDRINALAGKRDRYGNIIKKDQRPKCAAGATEDATAAETDPGATTGADTEITPDDAAAAEGVRPGGAAASPYPEPFDLFGTITPEPILDPDMLPAIIRDFALDTAARQGVCLASVAIPALVTCGAAIHSGVKIQHTNDSEWQEPSILWAQGIAPPGSTKTAALNATTKPLETIEDGWREEDAEKLKIYQRAVALYKDKLRAWSTMTAKNQDAGPCPEEPTEPVMRRLIATDSTMEGLRDILAPNGRAVLLKMDEIAAFYGAFDAYRQGKFGKDREYALKLFDGGRMPFDRVGMHIVVPVWGASIIGHVQDDKLRQLAPVLTNDGLMQRFLIYRATTHSIGTNAPPDDLAVQEYEAMVKSLTRIEPTGKPIRLSPEAAAVYDEVKHLSFAMSQSPLLSPHMRAHASKLRGIFARLLLVVHACDQYDYNTSVHHLEPVDVDPMAKSKEITVSHASAMKTRDLIVRFFIPNAVRCYAEFFDFDQRGDDARWIADYILAHGVKTFNARDITRAYRDMKGDTDRVVRAVSELIETRWLVPPINTGKTVKWTVNPRVHALYAERAEQERQRRADIRRKMEAGKTVIDEAYRRR